MYSWFCTYYFTAVECIAQGKLGGMPDDWFLQDLYLNFQMPAIHLWGDTAEIFCGYMEMKEGATFMDTRTFPLTRTRDILPRSDDRCRPTPVVCEPQR